MFNALRTAILQAQPEEFWLAGIAVLCVSGVLLRIALQRLKRLQWVAHTPTSRIRSAAQGYLELIGTARKLDGEPIHAPLTLTPCTWFDYKVSTRSSDGKGRSEWRTIEQGTSDSLFVLSDDTGCCVVDPEGATVIASTREVWYGRARYGGNRRARVAFGHSYRFEERRIIDGDPLFALGEFQTLRQVAADRRADIAALLRAWKVDRSELLRRFDHNGDGEIDMQEWESARDAAAAEVDARALAEGSGPDLHCLRRGGAGPFFLAARTEQQVLRHLRLSLAGALVPGTLLLAGGLWGLAVRLG